MIQSIIYVLILALIVDGIKLFIESIGELQTNKGQRDKDNVTMVLSAYKEKNILTTVETLKSESNHFVIVNDCCPDDTGDQLETIGELISTEETEDGILSVRKDGDTIYKIHHNKNNLGKVPSIHLGLQYVDTDYTFICDADIYLDDEFEMPVTLLEDVENKVDAIAFCVLPYDSYDKSFFRNILFKIQNHEYLKSMQIGRQFASKSKSVECISGAAGLFKTERIMELSKGHTNIWQGEDLERTLRELLEDGTVIYSNNIVYTDVPLTLRELTSQRVRGWWGGLYRNLGLMFQLLIKKSTPFRLKFEMFYNFVSLAFDPFKIAGLWILIFSWNWTILLALYIVYVGFEALLVYRMKQRSVTESSSITAVLLYPFYGVTQLHYRIFAAIYILYKIVKSKFSGRETLTTMVLLLAFIGLSTSTVKSQDVITSVEYSQYNLSNTNEWNPNYNLSLYVGDYYGVLNYGLYDQINLGTYQGRFLFDVGIREKSITPTVIYTHWVGNGFFRGTARYNYNTYDNQIYPNSTMIGVGYGHYSESAEMVRFNVDVYKQFEYNEAFVLVSKFKQPISKNIVWSNSASINSDKHYTLGTSVNVHRVYLMGSYYNNFEYTGYEFLRFGVGINF